MLFRWCLCKCKLTLYDYDNTNSINSSLKDVTTQATVLCCSHNQVELKGNTDTVVAGLVGKDALGISII